MIISPHGCKDEDGPQPPPSPPATPPPASIHMESGTPEKVLAYQRLPKHHKSLEPRSEEEILEFLSGMGLGRCEADALAEVLRGMMARRRLVSPGIGTQSCDASVFDTDLALKPAISAAGAGAWMTAIEDLAQVLHAAPRSVSRGSEAPYSGSSPAACSKSSAENVACVCADCWNPTVAPTPGIAAACTAQHGLRSAGLSDLLVDRVARDLVGDCASAAEEAIAVALTPLKQANAPTTPASSITSSRSHCLSPPVGSPPAAKSRAIRRCPDPPAESQLRALSMACHRDEHEAADVKQCRERRRFLPSWARRSQKARPEGDPKKGVNKSEKVVPPNTIGASKLNVDRSLGNSKSQRGSENPEANHEHGISNASPSGARAGRKYPLQRTFAFLRRKLAGKTTNTDPKLDQQRGEVPKTSSLVAEIEPITEHKRCLQDIAQQAEIQKERLEMFLTDIKKGPAAFHRVQHDTRRLRQQLQKLDVVGTENFEHAASFPQPCAPLSWKHSPHYKSWQLQKHLLDESLGALESRVGNALRHRHSADTVINLSPPPPADLFEPPLAVAVAAARRRNERAHCMNLTRIPPSPPRPTGDGLEKHPAFHNSLQASRPEYLVSFNRHLP